MTHRAFGVPIAIAHVFKWAKSTSHLVLLLTRAARSQLLRGRRRPTLGRPNQLVRPRRPRAHQGHLRLRHESRSRSRHHRQRRLHRSRVQLFLTNGTAAGARPGNSGIIITSLTAASLALDARSTPCDAPRTNVTVIASMSNRDDVQRRILARETGARALSKLCFARVPPRLCVPVERVVDERRRMLECVLLGFLSDGDHVVSYACGERGFELQIWSFRPGARATLAATTPIFESESGDFGRGRTFDDLETLAGRDPGGRVRVHVCESWDRSTLVVHGEERSAEGEDVSGRRQAKRCAVTVLPSPASVKRGTLIAPTHISYVSAAQSPFHPSWSGGVPAMSPRESALDDDASVGAEIEHTSQADPYAFEDVTEASLRRKSREVDARVRETTESGKFAVNTGDALVAVDITTVTLNPHDLHDRSLMEAQFPANIGMSVFPSYASPLVKWHGPHTSDYYTLPEDDVYVEDQGTLGDSAPYVYVSALPDTVRVCIATPWIALEMEKVLRSSLRAALDFGFSIRDYELLPLQQCPGEASGEEPSMLVATLSVLTPSSWNHQPSCPGSMRVVVTIIERRLDRTPGGGHVVYSHELPVQVEGRQPTQALLNTARAHVMQVRKSIMIPTARWTRNASAMTNTNVVLTGQSASTIKHPTLPICIVGYGIRARRE